MRKFLVAAAVLGFAVLIPVSAIAAGPPSHPTPPADPGQGAQDHGQGGPPSSPGENRPAGQGSHAAKPTPHQRSLKQLQAEGDRLVQQRLRLIDHLESQVKASKYLSSSDIAALVSGLENDKTQLNALKTKLAAKTTVAGAEADVKAIQDFSVGAMVVIARAEIVRASDLILGYCGNRLPNLVTQLQTAISKAPSGTNTTDLNSKLTDMQAQIKTACTDAQEAHDAALKATTLADLKAARPLLVEARQALVKAEVDGKQILAALNRGASPSPEASESPEPSESPKAKVTPTPTA